MSSDKKTALLLVLGVAICEIHTVLAYFYPQIITSTYSLWLSKDYHAQLAVVYYLYELENILALAVWFFAFWLSVRHWSKRVANVVFIFLLYFLTQLWFYIWNRNTVVFSNIIVYIYILVAILYIFIPSKKGKVVNF